MYEKRNNKHTFWCGLELMSFVDKLRALSLDEFVNYVPQNDVSFFGGMWGVKHIFFMQNDAKKPQLHYR